MCEYLLYVRFEGNKVPHSKNIIYLETWRVFHAAVKKVHDKIQTT